jgi:hypothetical protein
VGVLTVTMTGLRDAIVSSRQVRMALRGDLVRQTDERRIRVSALCAGFTSDRAGAHRAWFGPTLFGGRTAEAPPQRGLVEAATAKARTEEQPPATPKAEPRRHQPAKKPVAAAAPPPPSMAPLSRAKKRSFKGSKKH